MNATDNILKPLYIAICDDEKTVADFLHASLQKWAAAREQAVEVSVFSSAEAFLFALPDAHVDILLLDIQMGGEDGMSLAKKLRGTASAIEIIFITGYKDLVFEGYSVSALDFIVKPVREETLFAALNRGAERIGGAKRKALPLASATGDIIRVYEDDIIYIEAEKHSARMVTTHGDFYLKMSFSALSDMLPPMLFCRPHRSYMVSLRYIRSITKADIVLDSGAKIPLSRLNYKAINAAFIQYYRGV